MGMEELGDWKTKGNNKRLCLTVKYYPNKYNSTNIVKLIDT